MFRMHCTSTYSQLGVQLNCSKLLLFYNQVLVQLYRTWCLLPHAVQYWYRYWDVVEVLMTGSIVKSLDWSKYTVQYGELVGLRKKGLRKLASDDRLRSILSKHGIAGAGCPSFDC